MYPLVSNIPKMDQDLKGQSRGYDMNSLQTVPCHIAGMVTLSYRKLKCFQSDKLAGHVGERLHPHSVGL